MQKYVLYVGLNDKKTKIQEISTLQAYKIITNVIVANQVDGFTILEASRLLCAWWQNHIYWKELENRVFIHRYWKNQKYYKRTKEDFESRKHNLTNRKYNKWINVKIKNYTNSPNCYIYIL